MFYFETIFGKILARNFKDQKVQDYSGDIQVSKLFVVGN